MPIVVRCKTCGKKLKAPDSAAGKRAKCPGCGKPVKIPERVVEAEEIPPEPDPWETPGDEYEDYDGGSEFDDSYGLAGADLNSYDSPAIPTDDRRPCPMCGEMIVATAAKCRYCGEIFDESLRRAAKKKKKSRSSSYTSDDELSSVDWLLCIFCGGIGCIVGLVALCTGDASRGGKMIGLSLLFSFLWRLLATLIGMAANVAG